MQETKDHGRTFSDAILAHSSIIVFFILEREHSEPSFCVNQSSARRSWLILTENKVN